MGIYESIPVKEGLVLAILPTTRSLQDHSGLGHVLTTTGSWLRRDGVEGLAVGSSGFVSTPHVADLSGFAGYSCFVAGTFAPEANSAFFRKLGVAGRLQFYTSGAGGNQLVTFDGTTSSALTVDISRARSVGVSQANGAKPDFAVEGVVRGQGNATITVPTTNQTMFVAGLGTAAPTVVPHLRAFLFYNNDKTADEWAKLHAWSESLTSPSLPHDRRYFDMASQVPNGPQQQYGPVGDDLVVDGDMEAVGTAAWTAAPPGSP